MLLCRLPTTPSSSDSAGRRRRFRSGAHRRRRVTALALTALVAAALGGVLLAGGGDGGSLLGGETLERLIVGRGARQATVVRWGEPEGAQPGVIFLHGWGRGDPRDYEAWIEHLARRGNTVIVPRYQESVRTPPGQVLANAVAGIRAALAAVPIRSGSLVIAGHSAGGALAADYAATAARDAQLPRPRAIFAVYPGRAIRGYPGGIPVITPAAIAPGTRLVVMAGADDQVVGEGPALELFAAFQGIPLEHRRFARIIDPAVDDHRAPERAGARSRAAFWAPLDRLMTVPRRRRDGASAPAP